jgi:purine nucleosidase
MSKKLVLMDHDGAVDDYLSVVLLMTMQEVETLGVIVTPADCYIQPAVSATRKILDLMGRSDVPVAASTVRGLNPFPVLFRRDSFAVDRLPILNEKATILEFRLSKSKSAIASETSKHSSRTATVAGDLLSGSR